MEHKVYLTGTNFRPPIPTGTYNPGPAQIGTKFLGLIGTIIFRGAPTFFTPKLN